MSDNRRTNCNALDERLRHGCVAFDLLCTFWLPSTPHLVNRRLSDRAVVNHSLKRPIKEDGHGRKFIAWHC
jgi:hypothetical protein